MRYRKVGSTGLEVSEIGIGTWELSGDVWGPTDDVTSLRALETGVDAGATFIDTAAGYGAGHVEELVGRFVAARGRRDDLVISTKIKPECGRFAPPPEYKIGEFYSPAWIRRQCEYSLQRLETDYIDMMFIHTWSRSWDDETDWFDAMSELKQEGKVRAIGISVPDEGCTDANTHVARGHVDVIQCVYSCFQQEPEHSLFSLAASHGVGVIARSPYSSGAIVQDWDLDMTFADGDWRASWPLNVKERWLESQVEMSAALKSVISSAGRSFPEAALKFVLREPAVSSVIPGSANPVHVAENLAVSDALDLDPDTVAEIEALWRSRVIQGTYNGSI